MTTDSVEGPNRCPRAMVHGHPCQCDCCVGWCEHERRPESEPAPPTDGPTERDIQQRASDIAFAEQGAELTRCADALAESRAEVERLRATLETIAQYGDGPTDIGIAGRVLAGGEP